MWKYVILPQPGRHTCLWYLIGSSNMQTPLSLSLPGEVMVDDHDRFMKAGGDLIREKEYKNCI